jgi:hypothetical protein
MNSNERQSREDGYARLRAHADDCTECETAPLRLDAMAAALESTAPPTVSPLLATRVLATAVPLLELYAQRSYRKRLARSLLLTLGPLPVVAAFDAYMLREAYAILSGWLPAPVVAWILVGYAAMLLLLCALTYAALPVLLAQANQPTRGGIA